MPEASENPLYCPWCREKLDFEPDQDLWRGSVEAYRGGCHSCGSYWAVVRMDPENPPTLE